MAKKTACHGGKKTVKIHRHDGSVVTFQACRGKRRKRPVSHYADCVGRQIRAMKPNSLKQGKYAMKDAAKACKGLHGIAKAGPKRGNAALSLAWLPFYG